MKVEAAVSLLKHLLGVRRSCEEGVAGGGEEGNEGEGGLLVVVAVVVGSTVEEEKQVEEGKGDGEDDEGKMDQAALDVPVNFI